MEKKKNEVRLSTFKAFNDVIAKANTKKYLIEVLGSKKEQFVNNMVALVGNSVALQQCEPLSVMYSGIKATALDLPLDQNLGFAYVIPYNCKTVVEEPNEKGEMVKKEVMVKKAQFQLGYRAFIQLAIRTGLYKTINVSDVREGEVSDVNVLTGEIKFNHVENRIQRAVVGYVAYFKLLDGFEKAFYMTKEEVENHAKTYSQTYGSKYEDTRKSSKWATDFDAMAKKTVLKLLLSKWAPLSVQMAEAYNSDQAVIKRDGYEYVDNNGSADVTLINAKSENANTQAVEMDIEDADVVNDEPVVDMPKEGPGF